jgi:predicted ATPase
VVLIEGPAGIGKTRLLAAARERGARGMTVLTARCSELEREFSFGAIRQLFEPVARDAERRARLLAGAAAPVEGVLGAPRATPRARSPSSTASTGRRSTSPRSGRC